MAADYGALKEIVAISGSLIAAASAIGLAWVRRARWMPPEETVAGATAKFSALVCAVIVGALFVMKSELGLGMMVAVALFSLAFSVGSLLASIYTNTKHAVFRRDETRVLGGSALTSEAERIQRERHLSPQQLFENANYKAHLVWTPESRALVQLYSTMGFIALQAFGSVALASMAIALSLSKKL